VNKSVLTSWDFSTKSFNWALKPGATIQKNTLKVTPNGLFLFFTNAVGRIYKVDAIAGTLEVTYQFTGTSAMKALDISPSGLKLFVGGGLSTSEGFFGIMTISTSLMDAERKSSIQG
jgi:hypothetical protein